MTFPYLFLTRENIRGKYEINCCSCVGNPESTGMSEKYTNNFEFDGEVS